MVEAPLPPTEEELAAQAREEEEARLRAHAQDEWHAAALREDERLKQRVALLRLSAQRQVEAIREPATRCFEALEELADQRYKAEVAGVDQLCAEARRAVEAGTPILRELVLAGATFEINSGIHTFTPVPRPRPASPTEDAAPATFAVRQLRTLVGHLRTLAPSGVAAVSDVVELLTGLQVLPACGGALPPAWVLASPQVVREALEAAAGGGGWIDWRWLIVDACALPPAPAGALEALARHLRGRYGSGVISGTDWAGVPVWFDEPAPEADPVTLERGFHRSARLRELLFDIFAPPALTYYGREMPYAQLLLTLARRPAAVGSSAGAKLAGRVLLSLGVGGEASAGEASAAAEPQPCPLSVFQRLVEHACPGQQREARVPGDAAAALDAIAGSPSELATLYEKMRSDGSDGGGSGGGDTLSFAALFEATSPLPGPLQQLLQRFQAIDASLGLGPTAPATADAGTEEAEAKEAEAKAAAEQK